MKSLIDLQIAVLADDNSGIQSYLSEIDRKTETEMFQRAGEHFGFNTVVVEGVCYGNRSSLTPIFGFQTESGLRKIASKLEIPARSIGSYGQTGRAKICEALNLSPKDNKATLIGWDAFLVFGMASTNEKGREVQKYLLEVERAARIANGASLDIDLQKVRENQIRELDQVTRILARIDRINNPVMKKAALTSFDITIGGDLTEICIQEDLIDGGNRGLECS